jgi:hypothetical protein
MLLAASLALRNWIAVRAGPRQREEQRESKQECQKGGCRAAKTSA